MGLNQIYQYCIPFITLVLSGFALPMPEEVIVSGAGVLCGRDAAVLWWVMIPACILGIAIGDSALYFIGWMWGAKLVENSWIKRKVLSPEKREMIKHNYHEYGLWIVLGSRYFPGARTPVFLMIGTLKTSYLRFIITDAVCSIPSAVLFFSLGYWFADQFMGALMQVENHLKLVSLIVLLAFAVGYSLYFFSRRRNSTGDPSSIPVIGGQIGMIAHHQQVKHEPEHGNPASELP